MEDLSLRRLSDACPSLIEHYPPKNFLPFTPVQKRFEAWRGRGLWGPTCRLSKDFEATIGSALAWRQLA